MSLSDWANKAGAGSFSLVVSPVHTGVKSLKVDNGLTQTAIKTLNQSETDAPEIATIITQMYLELSMDADYRYEVLFVFRFTDINNYFALHMFMNHLGGIVLNFRKVEAGATNDQLIATWATAGIFDAWHNWEIRFCETPTGTVNIEIFVDDVYKYSASRSESGLTAGGAVGLGGGIAPAATGKDHYFDETNIYYT